MAIDFDGSDDHIDLDIWNVTGDKCTLTGWVYTHSTPNDPRVISKGDNTSLQQFALIVNGNDTVGFRIVGPNNNTGDRTILNTSETISMNTWYFLAGIYNGSTMKVYIDAVEKASTSKTGNIATPSTRVWIGGQATSSTSRPFDGLIDDVRVYSRALSVNELITLKNLKGNDGIVDSLEGRWIMNEASPGTTVPSSSNQVKDISGNGRHGDTDSTTPVYRSGILNFKKRIV